MAETTARTRLMVTAETRPALPPHIKLRHDAGRGRWIILAPERVFEPDEPAVEVLKRCDGVRSARVIANELSKEFNAPVEEILSDVVGMLQTLADKGVVVETAAKS